MVTTDKSNDCHSEDFTRQESNFEILSVDDPKYEKPHHLLVETTIADYRAIRSGVGRFHTAKIDIRVYYLFGPNVVRIGDLVTHMGGEILHRGTVRITNGEVMVKLIELRSLHIGTYVFNRIVVWAKALDENLLIHPIRLSAVDAADEKSRDHRNKFYRNFGLHFNFREVNGIADAEGSSLSTLTVQDLIAHEHWPNIRKSHRLDGFRDLIDAFRKARRDQRESHRLYIINRRRADRFDEKVAVVTRYVHMSINIPLYTIVALLAFAAGRNWSDWMASARHFLTLL
jgi:hypothetical protein